MHLTVICMATNKNSFLATLLPDLLKILDNLIDSQSYEVIVVVEQGKGDKEKIEIAEKLGLRVIQSPKWGYGCALMEALSAAKGQYTLTFDEDCALGAEHLAQLWQERERAEVIVASRYAFSTKTVRLFSRLWFSKILNYFYRTLLEMSVSDMSNSIRLYQTKIFYGLDLIAENIGVLPEILVRAMANGWRIYEVFLPHVFLGEGVRDRLLSFNVSHASSLYRLWRFRNSIDAADYDLRAYNSRIYFQKYWQRRRHKIITDWVSDEMRILDIGCGSSKILLDLKSIVGLDIRPNKLRFMKNFGKSLVNGTLFTLPFADQSFDCVICSEVIEHVVYEDRIYAEFNRVLQSRGILILGTPDYDLMIWVAIEMAYKHIIPGGYADEHITHYTSKSLALCAQEFGFKILAKDFILGAEIIFRCEKV